MRRKILAAVLAAAVSTIIPAAAEAGTPKKFPTTVTFDFFCGIGACESIFNLDVDGDWVFMGEVESPKRACRAGRRVDLYEKLDGPDKRIGSDHTDNRGHWFVRRPDYDTTTSVWYAKAPKKTLSATRICKADRSNELAD